MKHEDRLKVFPLTLIIFWLIMIAIILLFKCDILHLREPAKERVQGGEQVLIQENSFKAITPPFYIVETPVMGTLVETHYPNDITISELAEKIIWCESGGDPTVCNKKYGCKAGMGLFQLIPSTVKRCEGILGKSIDPFDKQDNLQCGMWLLENEGTRHWGFEGADWGSWDCWSNK